jgi:hypothetical protein
MIITFENKGVVKSEHCWASYRGYPGVGPMKIYTHLALLSVLLLMHVSACQSAVAQSFIVPAIKPHSALSAEQVVSKLVQSNLSRAQRLAAYRGTRTYHLEYQGFPWLQKLRDGGGCEIRIARNEGVHHPV